MTAALHGRNTQCVGGRGSGQQRGMQVEKGVVRTWFHSVAVSTSALHIEGPGFVPLWSHGPWSTAMLS